MFTKPLTRAPWYILINSFFLAIGQSYLHDLWHKYTWTETTVRWNCILLFSNWPELSPWSFTHVHVFKKIETTVRWNCMSKALRFLQITAKHQDFPFLPYFTNDENLIPRYLDNALTVSVLTSQTSRWLLQEKVPVNDFGRTVPSAKYCCKYNR